MAPLAAKRSAGNMEAVMNAGKLSLNTTPCTCGVPQTEYATAIKAFDWLYSSWHKIKGGSNF